MFPRSGFLILFLASCGLNTTVDLSPSDDAGNGEDTRLSIDAGAPDRPDISPPPVDAEVPTDVQVPRDVQRDPMVQDIPVVEESCADHATALFCEDFEDELTGWYFYTERDGPAASIGIASAEVFSGTGALRAATARAGGREVASKQIDAITGGNLYARVRFWVPMAPESENVVFFSTGMRADPYDDFSFRLRDGQLVGSLDVGPAEVAGGVAPNPFNRGEWNCAQLRIGVAEDAGTFSFKLNDGAEVGRSGLDTLVGMGYRLVNVGIVYQPLDHAAATEIIVDNVVLARTPLPC